MRPLAAHWAPPPRWQAGQIWAGSDGLARSARGPSASSPGGGPVTRRVGRGVTGVLEYADAATRVRYHDQASIPIWAVAKHAYRHHGHRGVRLGVCLATMTAAADLLIEEFGALTAKGALRRCDT